MSCPRIYQGTPHYKSFILCDTGIFLDSGASTWAFCPKLKRIQINEYFCSLSSVERFVNWDSSFKYLDFDRFVDTLFRI